MKFFKHNQRGDTIVEVLVALAIVSAVLAGAYAVASRSLRIARQSQERGEALKVAEAQIEKLKYMAADYYNSGQDPTKNIFDAMGPFCIVPDATGVLSLKTDLNDSTVFTTDKEVDNLADYQTCKSGFYDYAIRYTGGGLDTFRIAVRWERLGGTDGNSRDEIIIPYRLHQ